MHTQEPWPASHEVYHDLKEKAAFMPVKMAVATSSRDPRFDVILLNEADYERARMCVNALRGVPNEELGSVSALMAR